MFKLSISVVCELGVTSRYVATVCAPYLIILLLLSVNSVHVQIHTCALTHTHVVLRQCGRGLRMWWWAR